MVLSFYISQNVSLPLFLLIFQSLTSNNMLTCKIAVWSFFLWQLHFSLLGGLFSLLTVSSVHYMNDLALTYLVSLIVLLVPLMFDD
ncbi:hypothetical protein Gotri_007672 [Gossypium trilobum]|uniref:Uncharacterized protein n=1 Tax=Gossypium trilobum TaxID=34281 RepID=A0A7J9EGS6_9ROSI|nr:hypothetical protein [Gossypium trilobum]